ncbi:MAG: hypothetical protein B7X56_00425 [Burkholderiales bacterium 34-67-9]|nr:MAG: hypothetical protein B7X56_00425 [Burkholderiales bacterium 34-67-9]
MPKHWQLLQVEPQAPAKPALGQPCNGCGLCCLAEPCPLGMVLSLRVRGACRLLRWEAGQQCYRCGAILASSAGHDHTQSDQASAAPLSLWARLWNRLARRWIAAGSGCDATFEPFSPPQ